MRLFLFLFSSTFLQFHGGVVVETDLVDTDTSGVQIFPHNNTNVTNVFAGMLAVIVLRYISGDYLIPYRVREKCTYSKITHRKHNFHCTR